MSKCGWQFGCKEYATVTIVSKCGGYFGKICDDHADHLNRMLENNMEINERLVNGESINSKEIIFHATKFEQSW